MNFLSVVTYKKTIFIPIIVSAVVNQIISKLKTIDMRNLICLLFLILINLFCNGQEVTIIPQPVSLEIKKGTFTLSKNTVIVAPAMEDRKTADFFNGYLFQMYGFKLKLVKQQSNNYIRLDTKVFIKAPDKDAYSLNVKNDGIVISGDTYTGTFYGMQTLIQLLPVDKQASLAIESVSIQDYPRFSYRGMHLDVGRHFMPISFIKQYIDFLALHKMNYFHWHLTEDQGWRIEIKKYPLLTQIGAYRNGTIIGRFPGSGNDNVRSGGYYTQDEIKDIVQFAADRHITVVPEIEMPGHSSAAIAAYPWLSCFPNEKTVIKVPSEASKIATGKLVQETWGVFDDVYCAGKDSTFMFLQDVLDEVLSLFPSKYIHVGGDECPKTNWKRCPKCQELMQKEGLKDENELQSYFIRRMEKYLNSKGRILIGWDEILEGGLAPNALIMSWRGEEGGIAAAKQNHQVVMTPGTYVYFDHAESQNEDSLTIGGYLPLDKVYNYEPIPSELDEEHSKYVLGAQANVWTEYMAYPTKVEYMIFPRMSALSEVLWSPKEKRSWSEFEKKLPYEFRRYELWNVHFNKAYYELKVGIHPTIDHNGLLISLETKDKNGKLSYGITGKHFQENYAQPVLVNESGEFVAMYQNGQHIIDTVTLNLHINKATGKEIVLHTNPSKNYPGDGAFTLVDGIQNTRGLNKGREFLGWSGNDCELDIDLGKQQSISSIIVHTLQQEGSWIYAPQNVEIFESADGQNYKTAGVTTIFNAISNANGIMKVDLNSVNTRFIKVHIKNYGTIPEGKPGAGNKSWLFVDEIEVN